MNFKNVNKSERKNCSESFAPELSAKNRDTCVLCGAETIYDVSTPIAERSFYISGGGQLCQNCFEKMNFFK